jgi:hypothetical protein
MVTMGSNLYCYKLMLPKLLWEVSQEFTRADDDSEIEERTVKKTGRKRKQKPAVRKPGRPKKKTTPTVSKRGTGTVRPRGRPKKKKTVG